MLQSGNGCDELNVVTGNRVTQEACANAVSTVAKPQERTTDFPAVAPRTHQSSPVWHHADSEILGGHR